MWNDPPTRLTGGICAHRPQRRQGIPLAALLLVAFLWQPPPAQPSVVPIDLKSLARAAELIVIGTVVSTRGELDATRQRVFTVIEVRTDEVLKGTARGPTVCFRQLGGEAGGVASVMSDSASFAPGERVLLFLARDQEQRLRLVGGFQGKYTLELDPTSRSWMAARGVPGAGQVIDRLSLDAARAIIAGP